MDRIGVFICQCGPTLQEALDMPALARETGRLKDVVRVERVSVLCAPDVSPALVETIRTHAINRVVFAGCSPREHEETLRGIMVAADLNPFLMQVANIREHCAWTIRDRMQATGKARALIQGAVERVRHHRPLEAKKIDAWADVLVIGAGMAGISAARTLAQEDRRVFLVERSACIGGKVARYEDLYPDSSCAACLIEPDLDTILHDDRIEIITLAQVEDLRGRPGSFSVSVRQAARWVDADRCLGCTACTDACPVKMPDPIRADAPRCAAIGLPYAGALPHVAMIDRHRCLRAMGESCSICQDACPFEAVNYDQPDTYRELSVGAVVVATGFQGFDPDREDRYGHAERQDVITADAFERLANASSPTGGRIVTADGRVPQCVAFVHCVGSRTDAFNAYCSGVCCLAAFKHAQQVKRQSPETIVHHIYADLCLPGQAGQRFFDRFQKQPGIVFHRMVRPGAVRIDPRAATPVIHVTGVDGCEERVEADLVILATALEPEEDTDQMAKRLDIELDPDGFFKAHHPVTAPVQSSRDGIYLAGCCQGPKDIPASVAQGQAAAGCILQRFTPGGTITLDPVVARVDPDLCAACRTCLALCPCGAISRDEETPTARAEETLCRGCGICAAGCPSGAITVDHFSRDALHAEINGLFDLSGD